MTLTWRDYLYNLAKALMDGDMGIWNSATDEEREAAKEYLKNVKETLKFEDMAKSAPKAKASKPRRAKSTKSSARNFESAGCD